MDHRMEERDDVAMPFLSIGQFRHNRFPPFGKGVQVLAVSALARANKLETRFVSMRYGTVRRAMRLPRFVNLGG